MTQEGVVDGASEGLGTCAVVYLPLLVPRGALGQLSSTQQSHQVRDTVRNESVLARAIRKGAVESRSADGTLLHEDECSPESFAEIFKRVEIRTIEYTYRG